MLQAYSSLLSLKYNVSCTYAQKTTTRIADHDTTLQLLECCENSLREDLHRSHSIFATATETDELAAIKKLRVKTENVMVGIMTSMTMTQDREEGVSPLVYEVNLTSASSRKLLSFDQPLRNLCQSVQLQQAHPMRSATAPVPYAPSRHHCTLLYHSQQLTPTEQLCRIGYYIVTHPALSTLANAKHSL